MKKLLSPKYFLYLAVSPEGKNKIDISSNPRVDAYYLNEFNYSMIYVFQPPYPIWAAEILLRRLRIDHAIGQIISPNQLLKIAARIVKEIFPHTRLAVQKYEIHDLKLEEFNLPDIESLFWGRSLLETEIPELFRANGIELPWDPEDWMQYLYLQSKVQREAAVSLDKLGLPHCRRCGEKKAIMEDDCIFCGHSRCLTCMNCQTMGIAKSCIPLYFQSYPVRHGFQITTVRPRLKFELTPPQQRASEAVVRFLESKERRFLVWAVCGAGKTEVSFGGLAKALSGGQRVLFAIPRKDVVIELAPRLKEAFPEIAISALYGGSGERFLDVPLTIATTHQCLRFYQSFDLVILDEADAYPYQGCAMLHDAVLRAMKPGGHLVIMTATPDQNMLKQIRQNELPYVSIPARPHRKPLIVPEWVKCDLPVAVDWKSKWEPPSAIGEFLMNLKENHHPGLVFLPTIQQIQSLGSSLVRWAEMRGVLGTITHSKSTNRMETKENLLKGNLQFAVTSTIYERGITIPNLDVMVLHADNENIFDPQTLIQIAGRTGRQGEDGRVLWVSKTKSRSMDTAIQIIEEMNNEGYALGFLDGTQ